MRYPVLVISTNHGNLPIFILVSCQFQDISARQALKEEVDAQRSECDRLRAREKQLVTEMKKKGDLARQMLMSKDEELRLLKESQPCIASQSAAPDTPQQCTPDRRSITVIVSGVFVL